MQMQLSSWRSFLKGGSSPTTAAVENVGASDEHGEMRAADSQEHSKDMNAKDPLSTSITPIGSRWNVPEAQAHSKPPPVSRPARQLPPTTLRKRTGGPSFPSPSRPSLKQQDALSQPNLVRKRCTLTPPPDQWEAAASGRRGP
ncbi:hypothetical protein LEMLEM_LOCUS27429 [Lemmus lemmus]